MIDVLNLEWNSSPSRDRESSTLICNYLRMRGLDVIEGSIFQGKYLVNKFNPKVLFISNSAGGGINIEIIKFAKKKGIKVITGCSEGNFRKEQLELFFWGINKEKILYEDISLLWNKKSYDLVIDKYPELLNRLSVSGGVGFDRYKFDDLDEVNTTRSHLKKTKEKYSLTVLVSCWVFDFLYCNKSLSNISDDPEVVKFFRKDREAFRDILNNVIIDNPNILFILKEHPAVRMGEKSSAIEGLSDHPNTIKIKNEVAISEVISESDILLSYESTTALEAWLKGKQTFLLNPNGTSFPYEREDYFQGQPNFCCSKSISNALNLYINTGKIPGFEKYKSARNMIIDNIIEYNDGLNHVRFGNKIIELKNTSEKINYFSISDMIDGFKQKLKYIIIQNLYKFNFQCSYLNKDLLWDDSETISLSKKRKVQQTKYYKKKLLTLDMLAKIND